ncbi:hypothetical protein QTP88_009942 [Uroleucon formosanum]
MSSRDRDKFRSYPSGNTKRQKKYIGEKSLNKMRGSFIKYVNYKFDTPSSSIEIDNEVEINKLQTENKSSSNDIIINTVNYYDMTDIGCWPEIINNDFRKELIKLGPIQVKSYNFPQSEINDGNFKPPVANGSICSKVLYKIKILFGSLSSVSVNIIFLQSIQLKLSTQRLTKYPIKYVIELTSSVVLEFCIFSGSDSDEDELDNEF